MYSPVVAEIPDNLISLHRHEESIGAESFEAIAAESALGDHIRAVHAVLGHLTVLVQMEALPGSDRHTLGLFIIRSFNTGASALKLGLSGYYQAAFQLLREAIPRSL